MAFPYRSIDEAYRLVDEKGAAVVVPWGAGDDGKAFATLLVDRITSTAFPDRRDLRQLQGYVVTIPQRVRDAWVDDGIIAALSGEGDLRLAVLRDVTLYDPAMGLVLPHHAGGSS